MGVAAHPEGTFQLRQRCAGGNAVRLLMRTTHEGVEDRMRQFLFETGFLVSSSPTVVLVHGAFADASSYLPLYTELARDDVAVLAPANPLRGVLFDGAYTKAIVEQIDGPVILVGHSYGCAATNLAGMATNVVGLVYVAGYALEEGESLAELQGRFPDSLLAANLKFTPYPIAGQEPALEVTCEPGAFPEVVCADAPIAFARFLAASQRPLAASAFSDHSTEPAWKTKPCWGIVPTADNTINPDVHRFGFERAEMPTVEIQGSSHLVIYSHPAEVADVIRRAVRDTASTTVN
jgi:pimeloyl-ACP methyl ester carboxylesterase